MKLFTAKAVAMLAASNLIFSSGASADANLAEELKKLSETVKQLNEIVVEQQKKIKVLEGGVNQTSVVTSERSVVDPVAPTRSASGSTTQFNPDIGVIVDIGASLTKSKEDSEGNDKISVRELELIFGHDIDPYSRFDSTITLSDFEDVVIEEAYISHWGLPLNLNGRVGRIRPIIGKSTALHRDQLDTYDQPFVVQEFLGIEGLYRSALELNYQLPFTYDSYVSDITAGIMEGGIGESGNLFGETRRAPSYYAHLKNFWDLSETQSLELGGTAMFGSSNDEASVNSRGYGVDLTYINYITPQNRLKLQSEAYFQRRSFAFTGSDHDDHGGRSAIFRDEDHDEYDDHDEDHQEIEEFDRTPMGFYSLVDYRLNNRWGVGGRFDYVEPVNLDDAIRDATYGYSAYVTFYQSEFARFRLQYQHADLVEGGSDDRFFLQATAAIGVHKHKLQ